MVREIGRTGCGVCGVGMWDLSPTAGAVRAVCVAAGGGAELCVVLFQQHCCVRPTADGADPPWDCCALFQ